MLEAKNICLKFFILGDKLFVGVFQVIELLFDLSVKLMLVVDLNLLIADDPLEAVSLFAHLLGR